jgi:hypothetical protein
MQHTANEDAYLLIHYLVTPSRCLLAQMCMTNMVCVCSCNLQTQLEKVRTRLRGRVYFECPNALSVYPGNPALFERAVSLLKGHEYCYRMFG